MNFMSKMLFLSLSCCALILSVKAEDTVSRTEAIGKYKLDSSIRTNDCGQMISLGRKQKNILRTTPRRYKLTEKKSVQATLEAAQRALDQGFNYALMAPLAIITEYDTSTYLAYGFGTAKKKSVTFETDRISYLPCGAMDDLSAFNILWGTNDLFIPGEQLALVDLREVIRTLSGVTVEKPWQAKLSDAHYKLPGDKERILKQYDTMLAATQCRNDLRPTSALIMQYAASDSELAQRQSCLEGLRAQATSVKWNDFPLFKQDTKTALVNKGYSINRPKTPNNNFTASDINPNAVPEELWGPGWINQSPNYSSFSDVFMTADGYPETILLASNTLTEEQLLDYAVFYLAESNLSTKKNGIALEDKTEDIRKSFDSTNIALLKKAEKDYSKNQRRKQGSSGNLQKNLERLQEDLVRNARKRQDLIENQQLIEELKKKYPSQASEATVGFELGFASIDKKDAEIKAKIKAIEIEIANASNASSNTQQTNFKVPLASDTITPNRSHKGIYRAMENYTYVIVLGGRLTSSCFTNYLVCADKMQAYSALGPILKGADFKAIAMPTAYEPFDTNPR